MVDAVRLDHGSGRGRGITLLRIAPCRLRDQPNAVRDLAGIRVRVRHRVARVVQGRALAVRRQPAEVAGPEEPMAGEEIGLGGRLT